MNVHRNHKIICTGVTVRTNASVLYADKNVVNICMRLWLNKVICVQHEYTCTQFQACG